MALDLEPLRPRIAELCRRHQVRQLDVFGSAVRADFDTGHSLDEIGEAAVQGWTGTPAQ